MAPYPNSTYPIKETPATERFIIFRIAKSLGKTNIKMSDKTPKRKAITKKPIKYSPLFGLMSSISVSAKNAPKDTEG